MADRTYIAIDLKSFYASVECVARKLDPLTARLVVADPSRTRGTICLAVSPALKAFGISGRPRLFEVESKVKAINAERLRAHQEPIDFIVATPRMAEYIRVSAQIYSIYLRYIAPEDIHVYSIDEVFMDVTDYLGLYSCSARELTIRMIRDVLANTGITATAGIGTNLYLAKVAMDILAKRAQPDADGVRMAELDEMGYRRQLWQHEPLRDFWRVGRGYAERLSAAGVRTMGDIARLSLDPAWESWFYKCFGVNAELLIDHAWGWESCTMSQIKAYQPAAHSLGSAQVLPGRYRYEEARIIALEMADQLSLDLLDKSLLTGQIILDVGYAPVEPGDGAGTVAKVRNYYGQTVPKPAHGSANLPRLSSSQSLISKAVRELFERIVDPGLKVHYVGVSAGNVVREDEVACRQLSLFEPAEDDPVERKRQEAILSIKKKFGKNAILKGMDFEDGATTRERNNQIGGHKA